MRLELLDDFLRKILSYVSARQLMPLTKNNNQNFKFWGMGLCLYDLDLALISEMLTDPTFPGDTEKKRNFNYPYTVGYLINCKLVSKHGFRCATPTISKQIN